MKITMNTSDRLIVENNPVVLAVLISLFGLTFLAVGLFLMTEIFWMGLVFAAVGLGILVGFNIIFVRRTQFIFARADDLVEMRRKSLLGYTRRTWKLSDLDRAIIESSRGENGTMTYRAALVFDGGMDAGTFPITVVYSSGGGAKTAANAINFWLAQADAA